VQDLDVTKQGKVTVDQVLGWTSRWHHFLFERKIMQENLLMDGWILRFADFGDSTLGGETSDLLLGECSALLGENLF